MTPRKFVNMFSRSDRFTHERGRRRLSSVRKYNHNAIAKDRIERKVWSWTH